MSNRARKMVAAATQELLHEAAADNGEVAESVEIAEPTENVKAVEPAICNEVAEKDEVAKTESIIESAKGLSTRSLSPITVSEFGVLSKEFVKEKCQSYVDDRYLKEAAVEDEPEPVITPVKSQLITKKPLVDYSPSSTSTYHSGLNKRSGKENVFPAGFKKPASVTQSLTSTTSSPDKGFFGLRSLQKKTHIVPSMILNTIGRNKSNTDKEHESLDLVSDGTGNSSTTVKTNALLTPGSDLKSALTKVLFDVNDNVQSSPLPINSKSFETAGTAAAIEIKLSTPGSVLNKTASTNDVLDGGDVGAGSSPLRTESDSQEAIESGFTTKTNPLTPGPGDLKAALTNVLVDVNDNVQSSPLSQKSKSLKTAGTAAAIENKSLTPESRLKTAPTNSVLDGGARSSPLHTESDFQEAVSGFAMETNPLTPGSALNNNELHGDDAAAVSTLPLKSSSQNQTLNNHEPLTSGISHGHESTQTNLPPVILATNRAAISRPVGSNSTVSSNPMQKSSLTLGIRHPNKSSAAGRSSAKTQSTPSYPCLVSKPLISPGTADKSSAGSNLSLYQRLKMKNVSQNEKILSELLKDKPSISPAAVSPVTPTPVKKAAKRGSGPQSAPSPPKRRGKLKRSSKDAARALITNIQKNNSSDEDDHPNDSDSSSTYATPLLDEANDSDVSHTSSMQASRDSSPVREEPTVPDRSTIAEESINPDDPVTAAAAEIDAEVEPVAKRKVKEVQAERKLLKNTGQSYVGVKGKVVAARKCLPPHNCRVRKCHVNITPEVGQQLFDEYWEQSNHDKRVSYVAARMEREEVQRKRVREELSNREKEQTFKYFFDINGKRIPVCRSTFLNTLGETDRFVRTVAGNKSKSGTGITKDDKRGHHPPSHAQMPELKERIENHIKSFPAYVSHYCRAQTNQLYLPSDLTVAKMHLMYIEDGNPTVSYTSYLKEFNKSGRKFHAPKSDGCDKCDQMEAALKSANDEEAIQITREKELHLRKAEKAYSLKREAKEAALKEKDKKRVLVFDLQQCLPTPHLQCKKVYYSRQFYVYNFTITDTVTNLTYCYMWDQVEGKRGSNELASCLLQHILTEVPQGVEDLKLFSDCCSGQNRNNAMCMMLFAALQEHPTLKSIKHFFLVPGHTFMPEVDSKHSVIEKYKRKHLEKVNVPSEWYTAVENAGKTVACPEGKFRVIHKTRFYDIAALAKKELVKRSVCTDKENFSYMATHIFSYDKQSLGIVKVKSSFNEEAPYRDLSFLRRGSRSDRLVRLMPQLQVLQGNVPVAKEKKKDLLGLLSYLDVQHHAFYQSLPSDNNVPDTHPDMMNAVNPDEPTSDTDE